MSLAGPDLTDIYPLRWVGQQAVVALPTEVDITNAGQVRQALAAAASHGPAVLIIDMSATTFCDSAGVHAIVAARKRAVAAGTQLRLVVTAVRRIFELTGVSHLVAIYPTVEAALAQAPEPASPNGAAAAPGETIPGSEPPDTPPNQR